jgi:signal recognition particle receptor subunit beta
MALFNYATREINCKIVYYGPALCGKTTNVQYIHQTFPADQKGQLITLPSETDRTLYFDFLPLQVTTVRGFKVRFQLFTVPGQVFHNATRKLVLKSVDGIVFVADSQAIMMDGNVESLLNLDDNLLEYKYDLMQLPFVLQFNKRDLPDLSPAEELAARLNRVEVLKARRPELSGDKYRGFTETCIESVATNGPGVNETLQAIGKQVIARLRQQATNS